MRLASSLAAAAFLLAASSAAATERGSSVVTRAGITATLPAGWYVVDERLTPCVNPIERLTVGGRGAMVMLQETLDPRRYVSRFGRRPARFSLRGRPQPLTCCAPSKRPGWLLSFRDAGRGFYVYVYLGGRGTRGEALRVLDGLRITPRSS